MSVASYINTIHEALDANSLYDSIEHSMVEMGLGSRFAVFFDHPSERRYQVASSRNLNNQEIDCFGGALEREYPAQGKRLTIHAADLKLCCARLVFRGKAFGVLIFPVGKEVFVSIPDSDFENLFRAIGGAIVKLQIVEEYSRNDEISKIKIDAVNRIAGLLKNLDLEPLLARLLQSSLEILNADVGAIVLRQENGSLVCQTELGLREELVLNLTDCQGRLFIERVMQQAKPILIRDAVNDDRIDLSGMANSLKSLICLPLSTKTVQLGAIVIVNNADDFDQDDFEVFSTIGYLASAAIENALLRIVQVKAERGQEQMKLAREIQGNMQAKSVPIHADFDLDGWCIPCDETGGDYFDFIDFASGEIGIVVGDATGHGISAALTMVAVRASLLSMVKLGFPLTDVFRHVNNRIEADGNTDRFMTLFCGLLDPTERVISYCSAGHDSPFLYRPSTDEIVELESTGIPIGMFADWKYELCENIPLQKDDILVISTDGVREGFNINEEPFGNDRFKQLIRESRGLTATQISRRIRSNLLEFIEPAPRTDDITVVVVVVR